MAQCVGPTRRPSRRNPQTARCPLAHLLRRWPRFKTEEISMPDGSAGGGFSTFQVLLLKRVTQLAQEWSGHEESKFVPMVPKGKSHFVMPIGLVMVVDEANGGNATAQELVRSFDLLHRESGKVIDF